MAEPQPPVRFNFAAFYRATLAPLRRYLARIVGSQTDAQDLAHDAYARVYPVMKDQQLDQPQAYLYTTARRLAINQLKRRSIAPVDHAAKPPLDTTPSAAPGVAQVVMARQEWAQMQQAIAELPAGCRQVLLLCKVERLSHDEIAQRLGVTKGTVDKQHVRALRLLRAALLTPPVAGPAAELKNSAIP